MGAGVYIVRFKRSLQCRVGRSLEARTSLRLETGACFLALEHAKDIRAPIIILTDSANHLSEIDDWVGPGRFRAPDEIGSSRSPEHPAARWRPSSPSPRDPGTGRFVALPAPAQTRSTHAHALASTHAHTHTHTHTHTQRRAAKRRRRKGQRQHSKGDQRHGSGGMRGVSRPGDPGANCPGSGEGERELRKRTFLGPVNVERVLAGQ